MVATIGPATESDEMLRKLINEGVNVARLNFSHADHMEHQFRVDNMRDIAKKTGKPFAILQDLAGPKIRIGKFSTEKITLKEGETFTLTTEKIVGDVNRVHVNYPDLPKEVYVGGFILIQDGQKKLEIIDIKGDDVICKVVVGGSLGSSRGVNLPGAHLKISSLTEKDRRDLEFGIKNKVDFIALSFVRKPEDIIELREILDKVKCQAQIIAKIETPEAVENIDKIIEVSDGIMVARGDLAIEVPAETVPMIQKMIIKKCNMVGKPVITAMQILESMIKSHVPTRAEVSDIANAILDGTDALMLSEETTLGLYPVEAVKVMTRVAKQIENDEYSEEKYDLGRADKGLLIVPDAVSGGAVRISHDVGAKLIFALTESGFTTRMISRYKPSPLIIAITPNQITANQLMLSYGCSPVVIPRVTTLEEAFDVVRKFCLENKFAKKGDKVVIAAGAPFNTEAIPTNMILVEEI
ncbi:MAG: pyruvate kinase [Parcubacteria group bacterium]|nr:pyruvate kinase [Parcubacteria group bacterium]